MLKILEEPQRKIEVEHLIEFDRKDDRYSGFSFQADENYNIIDNGTPEQRASYEYALEHPEEYDGPFHRKIQWSYVEAAKAECSCGERFDLVDEYLGACQCPGCGQWYNLFGQALQAPKYWENDADYERDYLYDQTIRESEQVEIYDEDEDMDRSPSRRY